MRWLLLSLALQNLGRRKARSLLLIAAVALGSGVVFTGAVLMQSIDRSMAVGFTRLGADMMVVPEGALTNITASLLVVEPTELVLDGDALARAKITSLGRVAAQKVVRVEHSGIGSDHESADLIGFEPERDFTVQPWLGEKLNRPLQAGDVILGAARDGVLGSQLLIFGKPHVVYGRLGRTGVGTHERGVFMSFATLEALGEAIGGHGTKPAVLVPGKVTGFLAELAPGATPLQARFAILSTVKGVKVVAGDTTLSGIRQGLAVLIDGILALMVLMFISTALMVSVLFSAIVTERRSELGLLKAIGARRGQVLGVMVTEAVLATGIGGILGAVLGVLVMRLFERSLVYYLENVGVPFLWVDLPRTIAFAAGAIVLASAIGVLGVLYPAWRASRRDAYDLVRSGGLTMLSCRSLRKSYVTERGEVLAVDGIDLDVETGRYAAIIGRSGSGKSSLMAMVGGLSRPSDGTVVIDGTDIWDLSDDKLADFRNRRIGFVFQFASLLPTLRLVDNVALPAMFGKRGDADVYGKAGLLLARMGLGDHLDAYPSECSAGEQRRAAIARALINDPVLLLADEPTSDLDEQTEIEIMDELLAVNRELGTTLVLVTHNLALAEQAEQIVHIAGGQIAS